MWAGSDVKMAAMKERQMVQLVEHWVVPRALRWAAVMDNDLVGRWVKLTAQWLADCWVIHWVDLVRL
jgi:hypothetical protein